MRCFYGETHILAFVDVIFLGCSVKYAFKVTEYCRDEMCRTCYTTRDRNFTLWNCESGMSSAFAKHSNSLV